MVGKMLFIFFLTNIFLFDGDKS